MINYILQFYANAIIYPRHNIMYITLLKRSSPFQIYCIDYCSLHNSDVIMNATASQIAGVLIVCSTVCSGANQRKHQSSVSLTFVRGNHRWPVDSLHKGPVTQKRFSFDDVIIGVPMNGNVAASHDVNLLGSRAPMHIWTSLGSEN